MKLGLGTVQFGTAYGISNVNGQTSAEEVQKILKRAKSAGVSVLDTAPAYGTAEAVLGQCLKDDNHFRIITKTQSKDPGGMRTTLLQSLGRLHRKGVEALLFHKPSDIFEEGGEALVNSARDLISEGLVSKIGVSIYTAEDIDLILDVFTPDVVQVPANVFDQRLLASGHLAKLKDMGVEIHVRSIFLQGLLLMGPEQLDAYFSKMRPHVMFYRSCIERMGLSPLEAALQFAMGRPEFDTVLVGVSSLKELEDILNACSRVTGRSADMSQFSFEDDELLNPSLWKASRTS